MPQAFVLLITSFVGFLCTLFIYLKSKEHDSILLNKFLFIVILIQPIVFLLIGIQLANPDLHIGYFIKILNIILVLHLPCFYLYFEDISNISKLGNKLMYHFIAPLALLVFYFTAIVIFPSYLQLFDKIYLIGRNLIILFYLTMAIKFLYQYIWNRNSEIKVVQKQNEVIRNWCVYLCASFILIALIRIVTIFHSGVPDKFTYQYSWAPALVWLGIYVKIILTPEILFGYNYLNKTIEEAQDKNVVNSIWITNSTIQSLTIEKDIKLNEKLASSISEYIHKIEELSFHSQLFRKMDLSIEDLANVLDLPSSHLNYIFKYHCHESFTDYKKIVRINDSVKLINNGYLKINTAEALSAEVGFSSYHTFYVTFKSIIGVAPQEYVRKL